MVEMKTNSWLAAATLLAISLVACKEPVSNDSPVIEAPTENSEMKAQNQSKLIYDCRGTQTVLDEIGEVAHFYVIDPDALTAEFADNSEGATKRITFLDIELTDAVVAGISSHTDGVSEQQAKFEIDRENLSYYFDLQMDFLSSGESVNIETRGNCQRN